MNNFYEKHCNDFYQYIIRNEKQLKQEVRKNITYEEELFDEAYSDTIVKVANAILVNHKVIEDFRYYFFISFKQNFIQLQNKKRKIDKLKTYGYKDCEGLIIEDYDNEERYERIRILFKWLSDYLEEHFPPNEVDIYIVYYFLKVGKNRVSYKKMADIYDVELKYITNVIQNIKRFVKNDEIINKKKEEILYGTDFDFDT
jgi:hypothetical protein